MCPKSQNCRPTCSSTILCDNGGVSVSNENLRADLRAQILLKTSRFFSVPCYLCLILSTLAICNVAVAIFLNYFLSIGKIMFNGRCTAMLYLK
jgi:hypothetical protein